MIKHIWIVLLALSMSALAVDVVDNGGFEVERKSVPADMVQQMKKNGWSIAEPLRMPSGWIPNSYTKPGVVKYPDASAVEGKTSFTFRGTMKSTKYVSLKGLQDKMVVQFASKGGSGIVCLYLYTDKYAFVTELRKPFDASAEWKTQNMEIAIPKEVKGKVVANLCFAFESSSDQEISIDDVKVQIQPQPVEAKTEQLKAGMDRIPFKDVSILAKKSEVFSFKQDDNDTRQIRFCADVRIEWSGLGGYAPAMELTINGERIKGNMLLNKPLQFKTRSGGKSQWSSPDGSSFIVMYSSNFSDEIQTNENYIYGLYEKEQQPYRFVFDLTGKTQHVGENKVEVQATWMKLVLQNICVEFDKEYLPRINDIKTAAAAPAPTGKLDTFVPQPLKKLDLKVKKNEGSSFTAVCGTFEYPVQTRISAPNGKWITSPQNDTDYLTQVWTTPEYKLTRKIIPGENKIKVIDKYENLKDEPVGVIAENTFPLPQNAKNVRFGGVECVLNRFGAPGGNPTIIAETDNDCFCILLEDDLQRSQSHIIRKNNAITIADARLAIPAKGSHSLEWTLYYAQNANYYDIINAIRRDWNVNFTLTGPFSFTYGGGTPGLSVSYWNNPDQAKVQDFLSKRKITNIITHVPGNYNVSPAASTREKPNLGHGTALMDEGFDGWRKQTRDMTAALKQFAPNVNVYSYIHKNLCSEQDNRNKYPECAAMDSSYRKLSEGVSAYYVPTAHNSYGKKLAETYRYMIDNLGTNIYMDEICLGVTAAEKYPEWDQCTGIIDYETHELKDTVSLPNLLEREWMDEMLAYLRSKGRLLMGNAPPITKALRDFHAMFFTEECMGDSGLYSMHLSTPLGFCYSLGKNGFKHLRKTLEQGIVCHQYSGEWNDLCFPLTPIEVRPGYIIADERIITNRSGSFGWNDASNADVYVYNAEGQKVEGMSAKTSINGKNFFDIRMPGDHIAFIIRKK